jgi:putative MATE family efflux protein
MSAKVQNMTEGRPLPLIVSFSLPLMAGNIFQQMYTVVDTMVVGKGLGVQALAALGASDWLVWLMLGVIQGLTQGFGIRMAQEFGARQMEKLKCTLGCSVMLTLISALVLTLGGQLAAEGVLRLLKTPQTIIGSTLLYVRIIFLGTPVVMAYNLLATILRSLGDGRTPLNAMIVASLTNIGLDLLFVLVLRWGIAGAAAATLIAQVVSGLYCLDKIRKIEFLKLEKKHFSLDGALAGRLMKLGSPMAFQNAVIAIGGMIVTSVVNGFGVVFIGGYTASNKLYGILEVAATSYGYAMVTYTGQNLGAGKISRIREGMKAAMVLSMITSVIIAGIMILFGRGILGLFLSGTPEETAAAMEVAYQYLMIMSLCLPILYVLHVVRSAIQGMGDTVKPMLSGIAEFIMRTAGSLTLPGMLGGSGVFYAEVSAWLGADLILVPSYFITLKKLEKESSR